MTARSSSPRTAGILRARRAGARFVILHVRGPSTPRRGRAGRTTRRGGPRMHLTRLLLPIVGVVAAVAFLATPATADPPSHVPGGPCLEDTQSVQLDSIPAYDEVV